MVYNIVEDKNQNQVLGIRSFSDLEPVEKQKIVDESEWEIIINSVYKQIFGNAHIMDSDRLLSAESRLRDGQINVKEFVRILAKSELYRSLFFENCSTLRGIELNFKHLLGRAPNDYQEVLEHTSILNEGGYEAEIDSYIDSEEYDQKFGENIVPYYGGYKTEVGKNVSGFTHIFQLLRGFCSSDSSISKGTSPRLQSSLIKNKPSRIVPLSTLPDSWKNTPSPIKGKTTDVSQLLSKTLNLKTYTTVAPTVKPRPKTEEEILNPRRGIWKSQYEAFADTNPIELIYGSSENEKEKVIQAVYKQILGNAHIMESERLTVAESQLKRGEISVREFVRILAKSELYKSRFIDNCPRYRSHELNFKHLLGRAPDGYQETIEHSNILDNYGYNADIDSYIDSDEYQNTFGENTVPYYRGYKTQIGKNLLGYTNMFKILESISTSDKAGVTGNSPRLVRPIIYKNPDGNVPVTDTVSLIQEAVKSKSSFKISTPVKDLTLTSPTAKLEKECSDREELIAELKQELAQLQSLANIGNAGASKWQVYRREISSNKKQLSNNISPVNIINSNQTLQQRSDSLKQEIETLQGKIAEAKSFAAIGEARLNKWRTSVFN